MRWLAAIGVLVAAAAVAGVLVLARSGGSPPIASAGTLALRTSFDPASPSFGDRIVARVTVALDPRAVRAQTLRIAADLAPLTELGPVRTTRLAHGTLELVSVVSAVACLTDPCVHHAGATRIALPAARASVLARDGRRERVSAAWPALVVRGRVAAADLNPSRPPFEADVAPGTPTYRIGPSTLATLLDVLAALCAAGAVALGAWQAHVLVRRRRPRPADAPLERALRLARESATHPPPDRRRALELLARALGRDRRARAASELAWSRPSPEPAELERLVTEIEHGRPPG